MQLTKSYKLKNPYRLDQDIKQEVLISDEDLQLDYTNSPWVAVDTEYLSFNPLQDKLCVIQIASKENVDAETLRVEVLYVYGKQPTQKMIDLMTNENIEKLFHVFSADMPRVSNFIGQDIKGKIFDTKVAAKIAWTNTSKHGMKEIIKMFVDPNFAQMDNENGLNDWEIGPENWSNDQVFYMMQDVVYLDILKKRILQMAERRGTIGLIDETMKVLPTIAKLYKSGFDEKVFGY